MQQFVTLLTNFWYIPLAAVVLIIILVFFIVRSGKKNNLKRHLEDAQIRYNDLKTTPLGLKLSKAKAIARINPEDHGNILEIENRYEDCQSILKNLEELLIAAEDGLTVSHFKQVKNDLIEADALCEEGNEKFKALEALLDKTLEQQTRQRSEIVELKEKFRTLKQEALDNSAKLSFAWETVERNISNIEKMFGAFEDWTYAAEYEKANEKLAEIKTGMANLETIVHHLPALLEQATGTIPQYLETVDKAYNTALASGINMNGLTIPDDLNTIRNGLRDDLLALKNGEGVNVENHLATYKQQLINMAKAIKAEDDANKTMRSLYDEVNTLTTNTSDLLAAAKAQMDSATVKFDIENGESIINTGIDDLKPMIEAMDRIQVAMDNKELSASDLVGKLKIIREKVQLTYNDVKELKNQLDTARSDEDRAKKQLLKLQVVVNEMQVEIRERKLVSINTKYEQDVNQAFEYIYSIERALNESNLDLNKINMTISEANDFIYRLYNDVNNVVGTAVMVENAIVFGNRYRSTYRDVDSDLTRAELCFRNGEYTNALKIAIATIEKLHPNTFESLIKGNAASAA